MARNQSNVFNEAIVIARYFVIVEDLVFLSPQIDLYGRSALKFTNHAKEATDHPFLSQVEILLNVLAHFFVDEDAGEIVDLSFAVFGDSEPILSLLFCSYIKVDRYPCLIGTVFNLEFLHIEGSFMAHNYIELLYASTSRIHEMINIRLEISFVPLLIAQQNAYSTLQTPYLSGLLV